MAANANSIGLFDSGVGGLTVLKEVWQQLPNEAVIYLADNARLPYGSKTRKEILQYNMEIHHFLEKQGCKMVIMACNTSSSLALALMRERFSMPIVGLIEPGARAAITTTRNHRIGVIATAATIHSGSYQTAIHKLNPNAKVWEQACPLFVPRIEGGFLTTDETLRVAIEYLTPLQEANIDTLILGCTHYPHLSPLLQEILGEGVILVDPAHATVQRAKEVLLEKNLANTNELRESRGQTDRSKTQYFVTDSPRSFSDLSTKLLGLPPSPLQQIHLNERH